MNVNTHLLLKQIASLGDCKRRVKNVIKGKKYSFIAAFAAVIVIITAGIVLLMGAKNESVISDTGIIGSHGVVVSDKNVLSVIKDAITAKINDTIERDIIVCKKIDKYYFALIQYRIYNLKAKEFDGASSNDVYVFEDLGAKGVKMLAYTSNEIIAIPGFGVGSGKYGGYYIMYGNLDKSVWVPENDTRRETNYSKMVLNYGDGTTSDENVDGCIGYLVISKAPNTITRFTLFDKNGKTTKDDKCDIQYIKNLNAETEFNAVGADTNNAPVDLAISDATSIDEKESFRNSFEGHKFEMEARKFAKACLTNDVQTMKKYALDPNDKNFFDIKLDLYDKTSFIILKLQKVAENNVIADFEFDTQGKDSLTYLNVEMVKVDDEWKVKSWGLEK